MNKELNYIHKEVDSLLKAFGYKPEVKTYTTKSGIDMVEFSFHVNNGYETMPIHHKDAISMLAKGYLSEFSYKDDTQYVCLYYECKGLNPDDDRYSCLLHEVHLVSSEEPLPRSGAEVFVNMRDHFKRFVNWKEMTTGE